MDEFSVDMDICSLDVGLETRFRENNGPENETIFQLVQRSYQGLCRRLYSPDRKLYDLPDLECDGYAAHPFHLNLLFPRHLVHDTYLESISQSNNTLSAVLWRPLMAAPARPNLVLLYLHTNTRNLLDAKELIPLCDQLGCSLLAFDLPGHGKSAIESLSSLVAIEGMNTAIEYCLVNYDISQVVLWCRGMSTAAGIEYCFPAGKVFNTSGVAGAQSPDASAISGFSLNPLNYFMSTSPSPSSSYSASTSHLPSMYSGFSRSTYATSAYSRRCMGRVNVLVLDSPYTSIKQIVNDAIDVLRSKGYFIPDVLVALGSKFIRSSLTEMLGLDPYDVCPELFVNAIKTPCTILAATEDDYIATTHADYFARMWRAPRQIMKIEGSHFSSRPPSVICQTSLFIESFVDKIDPVDRAASSSIIPSSAEDATDVSAAVIARKKKYSVTKSISWHESSRSHSLSKTTAPCREASTTNLSVGAIPDELVEVEQLVEIDVDDSLSPNSDPNIQQRSAKLAVSVPMEDQGVKFFHHQQGLRRSLSMATFKSKW